MANITGHFSIAEFLGHIKSSDKDFRYMAMSDLEKKLEGPTKPTSCTHDSSLVNAVLATLDDASGDISAMAVKCLGLLVAADSNPRTEIVGSELGKRLPTAKKNNNLDLVSMALKGVIQASHGEASSKAFVNKIVPVLLSATANEELDVQNAALENIHQLTTKHGSIMQDYNEQLMVPLLNLLEKGKATSKKRSIQCLGALGPHLTEAQLSQVFTNSVKGLEKSKSGSTALIHIQVLASLSRSCSWRLGKDMEAAIPIVMKQNEKAEEGDDELKEGVLQALEVFIASPSKQLSKLVPQILEFALDDLSYDPNYAEDESMNGDAEDDYEQEDESEEEQYSDDEDTSWKVRKAAARLLAFIIRSYPALLPDVYAQASKTLISRFKEREESVKLEVLSTFAEFITQVASVQRQVNGREGLIAAVKGDYPKITKAVSRQLTGKSVKVKSGSLKLLRQMLALSPDSMASCTRDISPGLLLILKDSSPSAIPLRIQALDFLAAAFGMFGFTAWGGDSQKLAEFVLSSAKDRYYKIAASALTALKSLCEALRPDPKASPPEGFVQPICEVIGATLTPHDQDQEVKEAAISCTAAAIASLGDQMGPRYEQFLKVLLERLRSEATRLPAIKAFIKIAESPLQLPLTSVQQPLVMELISYLQKASIVLRQASLDALDAVLQNAAFSEDLPVKQIASSVSALIEDSDLLLSASGLHVGIVLLRSHGNAGQPVSQYILPKALQLAVSPLLQATAMKILQEFLVTICGSQIQGVTSRSVIDTLLKQASSAGGGVKAAQANAAKCVASLTQHAGQQEASQTLDKLVSTLQSSSTSLQEKQLALSIVGEIGRLTSTSQYKNLFSIVLAFMTDSGEGLKSSAAQALGALSAGDVNAYLPKLLPEIKQKESNSHDQYLLLQALLELLSNITPGQLPENLEQEVVSMLLQNKTTEDDCRNVLADCLGQLALLSPERILPIIHQHMDASDPLSRVVMVAALRMAVTDQPHPIDSLLPSVLPNALQKLTDPDWRVRRAAVQLTSTAANSKTSLIRDILPELLPHIYKQTVVDDSLKRIVDLGPFKHTIDDGLDLRKAAFECMNFLLDNTPDILQFDQFIAHLQLGVVDVYDIKMPCHLLLVKVAAQAGDQLLGSLDKLVPALEKTLSAKIKQDAVKQEVDRNDDMIRSCLRAVEVCSRIPNVDKCPAFQDLLKRKVLVPPLDVKFKAVAVERAELEGRTSRSA